MGDEMLFIIDANDHNIHVYVCPSLPWVYGFVSLPPSEKNIQKYIEPRLVLHHTHARFTQKLLIFVSLIDSHYIVRHCALIRHTHVSHKKY